MKTVITWRLTIVCIQSPIRAKLVRYCKAGGAINTQKVLTSAKSTSNGSDMTNCLFNEALLSK